MAKQIEFGHMVHIAFPFADADAEKNRWAMVIRDTGTRVVVVYCTTNPEYTASVRLNIGDAKVSNLVPARWEEISKERIIASKGTRVPEWTRDIIKELVNAAKTVDPRTGEFWYGAHSAHVATSCVFKLKKLEAKKEGGSVNYGIRRR